MHSIDRNNNFFSIPNLYNLSFLSISFLIAIDPSGDWIFQLKNLFIAPINLEFIQDTVLGILLLINLAVVIDILYKKNFIYSKDLIIIVISLIFSCILGLIKGANIFDLIIEASTFLFLPLQIIIFLNYQEYINKNLFKNCYYIFLFTTIAKIFFYILVVGNLSSVVSTLFRPGALKLASIYFCHGIGLLYTLINKKYNSNGLSIYLIGATLFIGIFNTSRSYFIMITALIFYIIVKFLFSKRVKILPFLLISLAIYIILITGKQIKFDNLSDYTKRETFAKRYDTLICFSKSSIDDFLIGTGIGTPIECSQEGVLNSENYRKKTFLRRNQTELGLLTLVLKLGLLNSVIYFYFFNNWLKKNINKNTIINNSAKSTLFFLLVYSLFKSTITSVYVLFFLLILILWNLNDQKQLTKKN
ncbi:MAG: hypothetical protein JJ837_08005 [Prochlorococcus marinus XMU1428]|nr:hypothetical protein [Prochlorococcus marinus XMU1428]